MSSVKAPPIYNPMVDDEQIAALPWVLFFNQIFSGDSGSTWLPLFTNLTASGSPKITGRVFNISQAISYFRIDIDPNGGNSTATAGSTYVSNFPLKMASNGICFAVSGLLGTNSGMCDKPSNNIYVPGWSSITVPLTVIGLVEAS